MNTMKDLEQLELAHIAWSLGAVTPKPVAELTGVPYAAAASCLHWIKKADGDPYLAWRLRCDYQARYQRTRYSTDSEWRHRRVASSAAWQHRQRFCRNGYRVKPSAAEAA